MVAIEDHWFYRVELTDEGFKFCHKFDAPPFQNAMARVKEGSPIGLEELDHLIDGVGFFSSPRLVLEAWRAGVVDQKTLAHSLIPLAPGAISPDQALTKSEWKEIFSATGFVSNFGFPAETLTVYRCCAEKWKGNICWTTHPSVALGVAESNRHETPILYQATVPPEAMYMRFCGSEVFLDTEKIHIKPALFATLRTASQGSTAQKRAIAARAEMQRRIWEKQNPMGTEAWEATTYDYARAYQDKRDQIDLLGITTLDYVRAFQDYEKFAQLRNALRTDLRYG